MKYRPIYIILAASLTLWASCSGQDDEPGKTGPVPIRLATNVNVQSTRAQAQDIQLTSGQTVYVWAKHTGTDDDYLRAWSLTADGSGNLNPTTSTDLRYYPADGTNVDLYALHGNITDPATITTSTTPNATSSDDATDGTGLPAVVTHTIKSSQESAANYSTSDLFAVKVKNVGPRLNPNQGNNYYATLPFQHQLARLEVAIVNFNDLLPEDIESITLCGVKTQTTFYMPDASSANGYIGAVGTTAESPTADIVMHPIDDDAPTRITAAECIIPQQELTAPTLIHIKLKQNIASTEYNDDLYYKPVYKDENHPDGAKFEIYNGVTYRLELSITEAEITGYRVGWTAWSWKALDSLTYDDDGMLYYFPKTMETSSSSVLSPTGSTSTELRWEYGRSDFESGNEQTKGKTWL